MSNLEAVALAKVTKGLLRGPVEGPLSIDGYLTSVLAFDILHRRAGREARPPYGGHGDAHKYCEGYSCGRRSRAGQSSSEPRNKSQKITAWRKAKAAQNRAYLEEEVYGR